MKILEYPNEILEKPCEPIKEITQEIRDLAKEMYQTMLENDGIGLAAPQIGQSIQLVVMKYDNKPLYLINPRILLLGEKISGNEGCLSFKNQFYNIKRPKTCVIEYTTISNQTLIKTFRGIDARCVLHELEHLKGETFLQHLTV